MRFVLTVATCFSVCLFLSANNAHAHGPSGGGGHGGSGHGGGGHATAGAHSATGNGFFPVSGTTGGSGNLAANRTGNTTRVNLSGQNLNSLNGTNGTNGNSSSTNTANASSGTTNTNASGGGSPSLAGEMARIHHLEQELRRLKMQEALQLLQQAKQSNNPQLLAKAEQMLQHHQQNRSQQGGNGNATAPTGQPTAHLPHTTGGGQSGNPVHLSHTSPGGHSGGHAHR